jgi:hypothetical protein
MSGMEGYIYLDKLEHDRGGYILNEKKERKKQNCGENMREAGDGMGWGWYWMGTVPTSNVRPCLAECYASGEPEAGDWGSGLSC